MGVEEEGSTSPGDARRGMGVTWNDRRAEGIKENSVCGHPSDIGSMRNLTLAAKRPQNLRTYEVIMSQNLNRVLKVQSSAKNSHQKLA